MRGFEAEEQARAGALMERAQAGNGQELDVLDLFPEFSLTQLYGQYMDYEGLGKYLILYDHVVVNLYPDATEDAFLARYGMSVREFDKLVAMGHVCPVVCSPFDTYPDFYAPLFRRGLPRSSRTRQYLAHRQSMSQSAVEDRVRRIPSSQAYERYILKRYGDGGAADFEKFYSCDLFDMQMLGLGDLVDWLLEQAFEDPVFAHDLTKDYCNFLARPVFDCLGGVTAFGRDDLDRAKARYLPVESRPLATRRASDPEAVQRVGLFDCVHPADLSQFFPEALTAAAFGEVEDAEKFAARVNADPDVREFRLRLAQVARTHRLPTDLGAFAEGIAESIRRDRKVHGWVRGGTRVSMHLGATCATTAVGYVEGISLAQLVALTSAATVAQESVRHRLGAIADRVASAVSQTVLRMPAMATHSRPAEGA